MWAVSSIFPIQCTGRTVVLTSHARRVEMAQPEHYDPGPKHYRRYHGCLADNICQQDRWNQRAVYRNHADSFYCLLYLMLRWGCIWWQRNGS